MSQNILVVDDDPLVLRSVKRLLDNEGYHVEAVKSAKQGFERIKSQDFHILICDIRMPEIDGIELTTQIKDYHKSQNKPELPIIFITGYASEEASIKAIKLGAKDYILKPFDLEKLLGAVKKAVSDIYES